MPDKITIIREFSESLLEIMKAEEGVCKPLDEKELKPPTSPTQELCRISAYAVYLLDAAVCHTEQCCDDAYETYCKVVVAC